MHVHIPPKEELEGSGLSGQGGAQEATSVPSLRDIWET